MKGFLPLSSPFTPFLVPAVVSLLAGCSCPAVKVEKYFSRQSPDEAVRYFQLSVELEMWKKAAKCLISEEHDIGPWELWWALGENTRKELGGFSLKQVILGVYWVSAEEDGRGGGGRAVASVLTHPDPDREVDQLYHLALERRSGLWYLNLERSLELNM